jgi:hypothetical protein
VGKIAPRPAPLPKTVVYFNGGHDPFAPGPDQETVTKRVAEFLEGNLDLPKPL